MGARRHYPAPETPVSDAAGAPHPFILLDEATGSKAGEAAAEALAEAAVDAVYGALVAATLLEEWAGASTDNPVSAADARGPGLECRDCFENFYKEYDVEPWLWRRAMREGWSELGDWTREEMEAAEEEMRRGGGSDAYGLQISQLCVASRSPSLHRALPLSLANSLAAAFMPPRGLLTLVVLSPAVSSSDSSLSSASF